MKHKNLMEEVGRLLDEGWGYKSVARATGVHEDTARGWAYAYRVFELCRSCVAEGTNLRFWGLVILAGLVKGPAAREAFAGGLSWLQPARSLSWL